MGRRKNRKRRKERKRRARDKPKQPLPAKGTTGYKRTFKGEFRGGTKLELEFDPTLVKVEDPSDPGEGLEEKVQVQKALEKDLPDSVH